MTNQITIQDNFTDKIVSTTDMDVKLNDYASLKEVLHLLLESEKLDRVTLHPGQYKLNLLVTISKV